MLNDLINPTTQSQTSMTTTFIHTADWQLGKLFAGIEDVQKRSHAQQERIEVIHRLGAIAAQQKAEFIVVAGDLFDSPTASKATVSAACSAIGKLKIPVLVIPGNHDHGGPGSLWEQEFFLREQSNLAPNLHVLLKPEPMEMDSAIIFPCPLLRRAESSDTSEWLRSPAIFGDGAKTRIILAHGSTQSFGSQLDDDEGGAATANQIDLSRLPGGAFDYIALGDWHGTKQINPKAWFSGTPELDRFPKGGEYDSGNVLVVEASRGDTPKVTPVRSARFGWHDFSFDFADDTGLAQFQERVASLVGQRAGEDLLRLELSGSLGMDASTLLEQFLESLEARLLRVKLMNRTVVAPTEQEVQALTQRAGDPLIARVATELVTRSAVTDESAAVARVALRLLHAACVHP
jgi:DNA repair exonuclease SbcCD nuclease subunit